MLSLDLGQLRANAYDFLLDANYPQPSHRIARSLFGPRRHEHPETQVVVRMLLSDDPRFIETHDHYWCARSAPHVSVPLDEATFAVVDLETTGSIIGVDEIIEIGVVIVQENRVVENFSSLVKSVRPVPPWVANLTGIHTDDLVDAPPFSELADRLQVLLRDSVFVAHDIRFDLPFIRWEFARYGKVMPRVTGLCTLQLSRTLWPELASCSLVELARHFKIPHRNPHRAVEDAQATAGILREVLSLAKAHGLARLSDLFQRPTETMSSKLEHEFPLAAEASD